jgi:sugar phosphate isomerase/epimerase
MDIGFQLYSARNYPLADVLKKVAALGYTQVEGYGALYADPDPAALKAQLDAERPHHADRAHLSLGDLEDTVEDPEARRDARHQGRRLPLARARPTARPRPMAGRRSAIKLQKIGKPFQDAGLTSSATTTTTSSSSTYDGKLRHGPTCSRPPRRSMCEADVAWIVRGKADPATWLEPKFGHRIVAVHVKDLAPAGQNADDEGGWADAGHGTVPWKTLWPIVRN